MRILRTLALTGTIGLSTVVTCLVAADRLAHGGAPARAATIAQARGVGPGVGQGLGKEPETTGTVTQRAEEAKPVRLVNGFDTERLNALMRGEIPPEPAPRRR